MNNLICVFDLETTGIYQRSTERIVEIAAVLMDLDGNIVDTYETIVNPLRDVGPTEIHGLTASDVLHAPTFDEIVGDIAAFFKRSKVVAAHNIAFDMGFLNLELERLGYHFPDMIQFDTMQFFGRKKLKSLCDDYDIESDGKWHLAITDTLATAKLVALYIDGDQQKLNDVLQQQEYEWPQFPEPSGKTFTRQNSATKQCEKPTFLTRIISNISDGENGEDSGVLAYSSLIDSVLEDRIIDSDEEELLVRSAHRFELSKDQVEAVHQNYLDNLIVRALADRIITKSERTDLEKVCQLLGIPNSKLDSLLTSSLKKLETAFNGNLTAQPTVEAEIVGKSVCITGTLLCTLNGEKITRTFAETLCYKAGLKPMKSVTQKLDLLVTNDANSQSGKMKKARQYKTRVLSEHVFWPKIGVTVD